MPQPILDSPQPHFENREKRSLSAFGTILPKIIEKTHLSPAIPSRHYCTFARILETT